eukprot:11581079-Alexandrium_andersonii.AAC.1
MSPRGRRCPGASAPPAEDGPFLPEGRPWRLLQVADRSSARLRPFRREEGLDELGAQASGVSNSSGVLVAVVAPRLPALLGGCLVGLGRLDEGLTLSGRTIAGA